MKIDLFNHFFPKAYFDRFIDTGGIRDIGKRVRNIQAIHDVEFRFQVMDEIRAESGDYCQVLTLPAPPIEAVGDPSKSPKSPASPMTGWRSWWPNTPTALSRSSRPCR